MSLIRFKKQTEYAFIIWMSNFPDSFHPLDMQRFYTFANTVARYRSKKWRRYDYFKQQVLARKSHFAEEDVEFFHDLLLKCLELYKAPHISSITHSDDRGYRYRQVGVKNGEIYDIEITEAEFMNSGRKI